MEADQLALLGDQHGIAAEHRFADWKDLVAAGCVDVLSIATPTTLHAPIAVAALDAGIHVLSEKPMAENAVVGQTMVDAARRSSRVLEVSFNHRRRGDVQALKKIIDAGVLGDIYYAKAGWLRREGIPGMGSWFTRQAKSGGGPLMDIGVHMLDMALHLLGEPQVTSATAATYAEFGPRGRGASAYGLGRKTDVTADDFDVEDLATAFLRLDGGGTLLLESELGAVDPVRPVLRHRVRLRRGSQHRVGRGARGAVPQARHLDREGRRTGGADAGGAAGRPAPGDGDRLPGRRPVPDPRGARRLRGAGTGRRRRRVLRLGREACRDRARDMR